MTRSTSADLLLQMQELHPVDIDMSLDRVHRLLAQLGHPEQNLPPVIHIAGTNGKGSTLAMIRAGLTGAGQRVHSFTSPHLVTFHERFDLYGTPITEDLLVDVLSETLRINDGGNITFFEASTVAGFLAFARAPADAFLLEVGLGGRLDVTNVVDTPRLTVITRIDLDHQDFLGETIAEIAGEKAGILKCGVPCIVGPQSDEAMEVIEAQASRVGAPLIAHGQHWHVSQEHERLVFQDDRGLLDLPLPNLVGDHQVYNAGVALAALRYLDADAVAFEAAVTQADWPARMQRLKSGPLVANAPGAEIWLDGGHNPAAGRALAQTLGDLSTRPTWLIAGMLARKDCEGYLSPLLQHVEGVVAVAVPDVSNSHDPHDLAQFVNAHGTTATVATDFEAALSEITALNPNARILIGGSLYLAGAVLARCADAL